MHVGFTVHMLSAQLQMTLDDFEYLFKVMLRKLSEIFNAKCVPKYKYAGYATVTHF